MPVIGALNLHWFMTSPPSEDPISDWHWNLYAVQICCSVYSIFTLAYIITNILLAVQSAKSKSQLNKLPLFKRSAAFVACILISVVILQSVTLSISRDL